MLGTLVYLASLGVIGLVSYIWINNYTKGTNGGGGNTDNTSSQSKRPPPPPPRMNSSKGKESRANQPQQSPHNNEPTSPAISVSPPTFTTVSHAAVSSPSPSPPASSSSSSHDSAKTHNLLAMAMQKAPTLPKRPMLNILHAPTLDRSISPSHSSQPSISSPSQGTEPLSSPNDQAHREQVQWELISSEEKYIHYLNTLMSVYFQPLKAKADKGSNKLTPQDFSILFSNVEQIWKFHQMLLPALKTANDGNVASVLSSHSDYLKMYTKFVGDYNPALQTINKLYKNGDFTRFLKKQRDNPASEGMDIMSFLIMPVQRVPRYLLLLKELQKYTPKSHPHHDSIEAAIAKIGKIAAHINEYQRNLENASTLLELQHQIHDLDDDIHLFEPHRRLVRTGILKLVKQEGTSTSPSLSTKNYGDNFTVILFNDLLLYCTLEHEFRGWIKLQGCTVQSGNKNLHFELVKPKDEYIRVQRVLRFECPSTEEGDKWMKSIEESVKAANGLAASDIQRRRSAASSISH